jgi:hypothetical protein
MNMVPTPAESTQHSGRHTLSRIFIGPLPDRVLSNAQHSVAKRVKAPRRLFGFNQSRHTPTENDEPVEELINRYAYAFHLKLGGSEGDWNEERENSVKYEMFRRWRESPWGRLWRGRKDSSSASHARWVLPNDAGSFQVGDFLGLDTYAKPAPRSPRLSTSPTNGSHTEEGPSTSRQALYGNSSTRTGDAFVTAHSHISPEPETVLPVPQSLSLIEESPVSTHDSDVPVATSSASLIRVVSAADRPPIRDRLLRTEPNDEVPKLKPALKARALAQAKSDGAVNGPTDTLRSFDQGKGKTKAKNVFVRVPRDPSPPAPPGEVLRRTGDEMQETSAAAAEELQAATSSSSMPLDLPDEYDDAKMRGENIFSPLSVQADISSLYCPELDPRWFSVPSCGYDLRSDRMVVRVAYCRDDTFRPHFDEMQDRCVRHMQYEDWAEFMVIWRGHRLELYNNFVRGFLIPLQCLSSDERLLEIAR